VQERELVVEDRHAEVGGAAALEDLRPLSMIAIILTKVSTS
jgi:hypothetical protein